MQTKPLTRTGQRHHPYRILANVHPYAYVRIVRHGLCAPHDGWFVAQLIRFLHTARQTPKIDGRRATVNRNRVVWIVAQ
ncbi:MAG: hypothetical protein FJY97_05270 [candidate division Zixibacteria bacterium]|nr:hypothetical protein [candidate division Zixibacteria bacterium]